MSGWGGLFFQKAYGMVYFFFPEKAPRSAPVRAGVGTGVAVASPLTRTRVLTGAPVFKGS